MNLTAMKRQKNLLMKRKSARRGPIMNEEEKKNLLAAIDLIIIDLEKLLAKANKSIPKKRPTPE